MKEKLQAKLFQRDINMATAWWIDTGIHFKMAADVRAEYGSQSNFWERPKLRDNIPLDLSHVGAAIITFGVAILISIIAFVIEIMYKKLRKQRIQRKIQKKRRKKQSRARPKVTLRKAWAIVNTNISWWHILTRSSFKASDKNMPMKELD